MAGVKTRFKLLSTFGLIPKTNQIEQEEAALLEEFNWLNEMEASEKVQNYYTLEKKVTSPEFIRILDDIKADTFDKTNEYKQLKEFEALKNSKPFKHYFMFLGKGIPQRMEEISASEKMDKFAELRMILKDAKLSEEELKEVKKECKQAGNDSDLKFYFRMKTRNVFLKYERVRLSKELKRYVELEKIIASEEFQAVKTEKEDTERYTRTEEYAELQNYEQQKNSEEFKKFFALKDADKFDELKNWDLTFSDEFEENKLDAEKWIGHYFWGKALLNEPYSLVSDKHFPTDGKNTGIKNSVLSISTKNEKINGKVWDPRVGFYPKDFDYTSGLISTGGSFRQKYGRFEAKVKLNSNTPVIDAFWMASDMMLPEIDVVKTDNKGKMIFANHWGPQIKSSIAKLGGTKFKNDFFIYGIEWDENKITWTLNRKVVKEETHGVPSDPMYMIFSSGLNEEPQGGSLPASFEIDWVRCYQKN
jgi:beta-glucanase (GH16 family)